MLDQIDLTDLDNFAGGFPHELFAVHRREAPVWWHEPTSHTPDGEGFWSVATYNETIEVLRNPLTYSSERGGDRANGGTLLQDLPVAGVVLNMMDDPRHARIRRLVSKGPTPLMVRRLEDELRRRTRQLLDRVVDGAEVDFLVEIAAELPMQMICILLGVPEDDRHELFTYIEPGFDYKDREAFETTAEIAAGQKKMGEYGRALIAEKRERPADDMLSIVIHATLAEAEPPALTDGELYSFFSLLFSAGSDTTRNAIAGGVAALAAFADQLAELRAHPHVVDTAIEEILRWTTPSPSKRRTATTATRLGGVDIAPGDKVLVWEGSANRDDAVFDQPDVFDVRRSPNPHLGFGHGIHHCLGANLARLEIRIMLDELLREFAHIELAGPIEWTRSNRHTGIRHMPVQLYRASRP
jgi:cytochrome P450